MYTFSKEVLLQVFAPFIERLVHDHGCNRDEVIAYHIDKLVGHSLNTVLRRMPRGPARGWELMNDIREELKEIATVHAD